METNTKVIETTTDGQCQARIVKWTDCNGVSAGYDVESRMNRANAWELYSRKHLELGEARRMMRLALGEELEALAAR